MPLLNLRPRIHLMKTLGISRTIRQGMPCRYNKTIEIKPEDID